MVKKCPMCFPLFANLLSCTDCLHISTLADSCTVTVLDIADCQYFTGGYNQICLSQWPNDRYLPSNNLAQVNVSS